MNRLLTRKYPMADTTTPRIIPAGSVRGTAVPLRRFRRMTDNAVE